MKHSTKLKKSLPTLFLGLSIFTAIVVVDKYQGVTELPPYNNCFLGGGLFTTISQPQGQSRIAKLGQSGYLTYGPYIDLDIGTYEITLDYAAFFEGSNKVVGFVDRASSLSVIPGSEVPLVPEVSGENKLSLFFSANSKLPGFEFRVNSNGESTLEIKKLCIKQTE